MGGPQDLIAESFVIFNESRDFLRGCLKENNCSRALVRLITLQISQ